MCKWDGKREREEGDSKRGYKGKRVQMSACIHMC
jgi:hypothetical protein